MNSWLDFSAKVLDFHKSDWWRPIAIHIVEIQVGLNQVGNIKALLNIPTRLKSQQRWFQELEFIFSNTQEQSFELIIIHLVNRS